jgi:hypothetical protein
VILQLCVIRIGNLLCAGNWYTTVSAVYAWVIQWWPSVTLSISLCPTDSIHFVETYSIFIYIRLHGPLLGKGKINKYRIRGYKDCWKRCFMCGPFRNHIETGKDSESPQNLRPISLMSATGKRFETVIIKYKDTSGNEACLMQDSMVSVPVTARHFNCIRLTYHVILNFNNSMGKSGLFLSGLEFQ